MREEEPGKEQGPENASENQWPALGVWGWGGGAQLWLGDST